MPDRASFAAVSVADWAGVKSLAPGGQLVAVGAAACWVTTMVVL
jgi:hypothetical protein